MAQPSPNDPLGLGPNLATQDLSISPEEEARRRGEQQAELFRQSRLRRLQQSGELSEQVQKAEDVRRTSPGAPTPPLPEITPPNHSVSTDYETSRVVSFLEKDAEKYGENLRQLQREFVTRAKSFRTSKGEKVEFPKGVDTYENRARFLVLRDAVAVPVTSAEGVEEKKLDSVSGKQATAHFNLIPTYRYKEMRGDSESAGLFLSEKEGILPYIRSAIATTAPGKVGGYSTILPETIQKKDAILKNVLGISQMGRTFLLESVERGDLRDAGIASTGVDLTGMVIEGSSRIPQGLGVVADTVLETLTSVVGEDLLDMVQEGTSATLNNAFNAFGDDLVIDLHTSAEQISKITGMRKDVVEVMMNPEGFMDRAFEVGIVDGGIYAAIYKGMFRGAQKRYADMEDFAVKVHGGGDLAEAMANAKRSGVDWATFRKSYIEQRLGGKLTDKINTQMEDAMGIALARAIPADRRLILKDQLNGYHQRIQAQIDTARNAYAVNGNNKAFQNAKAKIRTLQKERDNLVYGSLVPRSLSALGGEMKWSIPTIAGVSETFSNFVGFVAEPGQEMTPDQEYIAEMFAAVGVATMYGRTSISGMASGLRSMGGTIYDYLNRGYNIVSFQTRGITKEEFQAIKADKNLNKRAKKTIEEIYKQPKEFQMLFFAGLEESATLQKDLLAIANATGVKLEGNEFIDSIGTLSDIGGLISLARSLDQKMTMTSLDEVGPLILQKERVLAEQSELLGKLGKIMEQFEAMAIAGSEQGLKEAEGSITAFNKMLRGYMSKVEQDYRQQRNIIQSYMRSQNEYFELLAKADLSGDKTGGFDSVISLTNAFDLESELMNRGFSEIDSDTLNLAPAQRIAALRQDLEASRKRAAELIELQGASITPQLASTGYGSVHAAHSFVLTLKAGKSRYDELYGIFDANSQGAQADIADFFLKLMDNPNAFVDYNPEELAEGLLGMDKGSMFKPTQRNFFVLFNEGAQRSLDYIRGTIGDDTYSTFMDSVSELEPLSQWVALRKYLLEGAGDSAIRPEVARQVGENMPLLINPKEWRVINKHIGRQIGVAQKKPEVGSEYYYSLKEEWRKVGDKTSNRSWKTGWKEGQRLDNVADDVNDMFREAQDVYEQEVFRRVNDDPVTRNWDKLLTQAKIRAATSDDPTKVVQNFGVSNPKDQPIYWLDLAMKDGVARLKDMPLPMVDDFEELYAVFGDRLGRMGGIFDPETNKFRIVVKSADEADAAMVTAGQQLRSSLHMWLQSKAVQLKSGTAMMGDNAVDLGYKLDDAEFQRLVESLGNIQIYEKTADGRIVPFVDETVGSSRLINEGEVYRVLDSDQELNALTEGMRATLQEANTRRKLIFDEWKTGISDLKEDTAAHVKEIETIMSTLNLGGRTSSVSNLDGAAEAVYKATVDGDYLGDEIPRLKRAVAQMYSDPEEGAKKADEAIRFLVLRHLRKTSSRASETGTYPVKIEGGGVMYMQSAGVDAQSLYQALGVNDARVEARLRKIIGDDTYDRYKSIGRVVEKVQGKYRAGVDGRLPTMSLDSILSRIYNINREVVSPQWVITESVIRAARTHEGALLRTMLNDADLAKAVLEMIDTGKVPKYAEDPQFWRPLFVEMIRQEAINENYSSTLARDIAEGVGIMEQADTSLRRGQEQMRVQQSLPILPRSSIYTGQMPTDSKPIDGIPEDAERIYLRSIGFDV